MVFLHSLFLHLSPLHFDCIFPNYSFAEFSLLFTNCLSKYFEGLVSTTACPNLESFLSLGKQLFYDILTLNLDDQLSIIFWLHVLISSTKVVIGPLKRKVRERL